MKPSYLKDISKLKLNKTITDKKDLSVKENGRSADFIMSNVAVGCQLYCSYCYIARNRASGNPLQKYSNLEEILYAVKEHFICLPEKQPNQCDYSRWTYDIGEGTDMMTSDMIDYTNKIISTLTSFNAKPTFATKALLNNKLISVNRNSARIRASLMPQNISNIIEPISAPIERRIDLLNEAYNLGYETHINFSPIVVTETLDNDYKELFRLIDSKLTKEVKDQLKCEVIFLTHSDKLHKLNLTLDPNAEEILWNPKIQEHKLTTRGGEAIRYEHSRVKPYLENWFKNLIKQELPYCTIRYIF